MTQFDYERYSQVVFRLQDWVVHGLVLFDPLPHHSCRVQLRLHWLQRGGVCGKEEPLHVCSGINTEWEPGSSSDTSSRGCLGFSRDIIRKTQTFWASLRKRWRSPQWTGVALRAGGQTKPTRRSVPAVGSSGHMETTQHTFRRRSNQRAQEGVLSLGTTQDGTAEGTGTMLPGQRTGKTMDRLRGAIDAGTLRGKRRPRRSRRTSKVSIQCRHQNHPGILSTGGIK